MLLILLACASPDVVVEPILSTSVEPDPEPVPIDTVETGDTEVVGSADTGVHLITDPCLHGESGPERDCGYTYRGMTGCITGDDMLYDFGPDPTLTTQALRICRATRSEGVPCEFADVVSQAIGRDTRFRCPPLVPGGDPDAVIGGNGGGFSIYTAEAYP